MINRIGKFFVLLALITSAGLAHAMPASVELTVIPVEVKPGYMRVPLAALTKAQRARAGTHVLAVFGLTRTTSAVTLDFDLAFEHNKEGGIDYMPLVAINFGLAPMQILLAEELPEGSCEQKLVLEHELEHVALYESMLLDVAKSFKDKATQAIGSKVRKAASVDAAREELDAELSVVLGALVDEAMKELLTAQQRLDSAVTMSKEMQGCGGALISILNRVAQN